MKAIVTEPRSGPGEGAAGVTYLSMRTYLKSSRIFPREVAATLLSDSMKIAVGAE